MSKVVDLPQFLKKSKNDKAEADYNRRRNLALDEIAHLIAIMDETELLETLELRACLAKTLHRLKYNPFPW
jgi:hypothetical protein